MRCPFDVAWVGRCSAEVDPGETFCNKHRLVMCGVCGEQATRECPYAGQFVCGFPLCDNCEGWHTGEYSAWGFTGHKHRRIKENQDMTLEEWLVIKEAIKEFHPVGSRVADRLIRKLERLKEYNE